MRMDGYGNNGMGILIPLLVVFLWACSGDTHTSRKTEDIEGERETDTVRPPSAAVLVERIGEIRQVANPVKSDSASLNRGDSLYREIVKLGEAAVPYLINKVSDNTKTTIRIPCRDSVLTQGAVAFMLLDEILDIPYFQVFEVQWDVFDLPCDFGYPMGLPEYISAHPQEASAKLKHWYGK